MSLTNKILLFLLALCTLGAATFIIYKQIEISNRQKHIEESVIKQKDLGDNLMRAMSQYATQKDVEQIIKDNKIDLSKVYEELETLKSKIDTVSIVVARSGGQSWERGQSTGTKPATPDPGATKTIDCGGKQVNCLQDTYGYFANTQTYDLTEKFDNVKVPIGSISFTAAHKEPWAGNLLAREYKMVTIAASDENQRITNINQFKIIVDGKEYLLPIKEATVTQTYPEAKFRWFSPRLNIGLDAGAVVTQPAFEFAPNLSVAIANYGRYVQNPEFSIFQIGASVGVTDPRFYFTVTPFAYNIGKHIPFMMSTYLGPSLYIATDKNIAIMAGLRVGL